MFWQCCLFFFIFILAEESGIVNFSILMLGIKKIYAILEAGRDRDET